MISTTERLLVKSFYETREASRLRMIVEDVEDLRALDEQLILSYLVDRDTANRWRDDTSERLSSVTVCILNPSRLHPPEWPQELERTHATDVQNLSAEREAAGVSPVFKSRPIAELEEDLARTDLEHLIELKKQELIRTLEAGTGCFRNKWIADYFEHNIVGPGSLTDRLKCRMAKELHKADQIAVGASESHKVLQRCSDHNRMISRSKVERYKSCLLDA
jgi:hypothetical protein